MGIPYQRHKPSAALRKFLDPLDPGSYFDCGRARLHGIDDVLLREAERRGRVPGDDTFQLVATDVGLIFCRPSISFAIAARWSEITVARPVGDEPVVMNVVWPVHGDLAFTVGKRLGGNVFRRWLQLQMRANQADKDDESSAPVADEAKRTISVIDERELAKPAPVAVGVGTSAAAEAGDAVGASVTQVSEPSIGESVGGSTEPITLPEDPDKPIDPTSASTTSTIIDQVGAAPTSKSGSSKTIVWHDGQPVDLVEKFQLTDPELEAKRLNLGRSEGEAADSEVEARSVGGGDVGVQPVGLFEEPLLRSLDHKSTSGGGAGGSKARNGKVRGRRSGKTSEGTNNADRPAKKGRLPKTSEMAAISADQAPSAMAKRASTNPDVKEQTEPIPEAESKKGKAQGINDLDGGDLEPAELKSPKGQSTRAEGSGTEIDSNGTVDSVKADTVDGANADSGDDWPKDSSSSADQPAIGGSVSDDEPPAGEENNGGDDPVDVTLGGESAGKKDVGKKDVGKKDVGKKDAGKKDVDSRKANRKLSLLELLASDSEDGPIPPPDSATGSVGPIVAPKGSDAGEFDQRPRELASKSDSANVEEVSWLPPESVGSDASIDSSSRLVEFPIAVAMAVLVVGSFLSIVVATRLGPSGSSVAIGGPVSTIDNLRYRTGFEEPDSEGAIGSQIRRAGQPPSGPNSEPLSDSAAFNSSDGVSSDGVSSDGVSSDRQPTVSTTTTETAVEGKARTNSVLCNSNYSGCVPDVSDVDCEGDGDGPAYIDKPVLVLGTDVYLLDTDSDGNACEPGQPETNGRRVTP